MIIYISPSLRIYIEAKRLLPAMGRSHDKDWEYNLIGKPFEYKVMLDRQSRLPIREEMSERTWGTTECFVVVDRLPEERFSGLPSDGTTAGC